MSEPLLSVLVVNWNTPAVTSACLDALHAQLAGLVAHETLVVDNGSVDGSADALALRGDIQLIANKRNLGFATAVNQAYRAARGELLLLLNPDVVLTDGSMERLLGFLREHPDAAGVGPAYVNTDGSPQQHHYRLPDFGALLATASGLRRLRPLQRSRRRHLMIGEDFARARVVEQPSASCLLIRRAALPEGPLLDERFPIFFNDVALARGVASRGQALWMTPDAVAVHELGGSTKLLGPTLARHHLASLVRYCDLSQPLHCGLALRLLIVTESLARWLLRRQPAVGGRGLLGALRADAGPLPEAPLR